MNFDNLNPKRNLPLAGIVAFSLCSTYSVVQLLTNKARHPSLLFWLPAVLIELVTAWAVYNVVEQARKVTKSNISRQDRRFYSLMLGLFLIVALPTLATSVVANTIEFSGSLLLGVLFPIGSIGCAIGVALPDTVSRYEKRKQSEANEEAKARQSKAKARQVEEGRRQRLASLGKAADVLGQLAANPGQTQGEVGQTLGISRRTVGYHVAKLERAGAIRRNGEGIEVLWDVL